MLNGLDLITDIDELLSKHIPELGLDYPIYHTTNFLNKIILRFVILLIE